MALEDTRVYKIMHRVMGREGDWPEIRIAMLVARVDAERTYFRDNATAPNAMVTWSRTSQGRDFWENIHGRFMHLVRGVELRDLYEMPVPSTKGKTYARVYD